MNIDHAVTPAGHECRSQQPHEAGKADECGTHIIEGGLQRVIEMRAIGELAMIDDAGCDTGRIGTCKTGRIRLV